MQGVLSFEQRHRAFRPMWVALQQFKRWLGDRNRRF